MRRKKNSEVYLRAAKLIFNKFENYSCIAINQSTSSIEPMKLFTEYLKPIRGNSWNSWMDGDSEEEDRNHRIIALLLMSEIAKDIS